MQKRVTILTDIPDWCREIVTWLKDLGWKVEVCDVRSLDWVPSDPLPDWGLVFNRIASRPANGDPSFLTKTRDLLTAIELNGIPCLNGLVCHAIGASKVLQASLLAKLQVPTPWTKAVFPGNLSETLSEFDEGFPLLIKPNNGGRGRGISSPNDANSESFAPDGMAILQRRISSGDGLIHRVEMIDGEVLYEVDAVLEAETFDYCLGGQEATSMGFRSEPASEIASWCRCIAKGALMDVGSVEYLIDETGQPQFIDINPVSSWISNSATLLGFDPVERISSLLGGQTESIEEKVFTRLPEHPESPALSER